MLVLTRKEQEAIMIGETIIVRVLEVNGGKVKVVHARVVVRQLVLLVVGCVDIKRPGIQCLDDGLVTPLRLPLKNQSAVQIECRDAAGGTIASVVREILVLVRSGMKLHFGRDVTLGRHPGPTDLTPQNATVRIRLACQLRIR